jgi:hypothetical protein
MFKINVQLTTALCATLLFVVLPLPSNAIEYSVEIEGVISDVTAILSPTYGDVVGPLPSPQVAPEFSERFAVGQLITTHITYSDDVVDDIVADYWGRYPLAGNQLGSIVVDGEPYQLKTGVISTLTDAADRYFYHAYTNQEISNPVAAMGVWLDIIFEGDNLLDSDALVPPPQTWDLANGDLYFDTGRDWQTIRFSVERS